MALLRSASVLFAVALTVYTISVRGALDWEKQRLNQFQQKYNNSRSDIIFLLDDSASVSQLGFNVEKKFINSLLSKISVQPIATRVAVVSFSETVRKSIDYIDYNQFDKNKCTFTKEIERVTHRKGRLTNMYSAFTRGQQILDDAVKNNNLRINVNTVFILLTDGRWNMGGSPDDLVKGLRTGKYHAEVLSVGVDRALRDQLKNIAGTNNNVIFANTFNDFENLAARIRGDQVEKLYQRVPDGECGKVCDDNAVCSCGTISGIYQCACKAGFFGSGDRNKCFPCPFGRYKTFNSPDPCKLCPPNSSHNKRGSKSVADCKCFVGYNGNPGLGLPCKIVECSPFPATITNGDVTNCGHKYQETCTFTCKPFYRITGESARSKKAVCQADGTWSVSSQPTCSPITCPSLSIPPHAKYVCTNSNVVNSTCTFECSNGYRLTGNGNKARTCQLNGQWSGAQPRCDVIQCPMLRKIDNVNITPLKCLNSKSNFNDGCAYECKTGFTGVSGDLSRKCKADGTWSGAELVCKDTTPPTITCPQDLDVETEKGEASAEVTFDMPTIVDNSEAVAQTKITVEQRPSSITSPHRFPIGKTNIIFTARDEAGNHHSCTFSVQVKDKEAPVLECPPDQALTAKSGEQAVSASWTTPAHRDNSGSSVLTSTYTSPHSVPVNSEIRVKYTARDNSGNEGSCTIVIKVNGAQCPPRDPPINGVLSCTYYFGIGDVCNPMCMNPYTYNAQKAFYYVCNPNKEWFAAPPPFAKLRWPDCTSLQSKSGMGQRMEWNYYSGNCHENITAQATIKENFRKFLNTFLMQTAQTDCNSAVGSVVCKPENIVLSCGKIQTNKKRSTQSLFKIKVDLDVLSTTKDDAEMTRIVNKLATSATGVKSSSYPAAQNLRTMQIDGDVFSLDAVQTVGSVTGVCKDGAIYDTKTLTTETCISCLAGKYFDTTLRECIDCPVGTYTMSPGRLGCTKCADGRTTAKAGSHNITDCKVPCSPGFSSPTGLENCKSCPKGFYQPNYFGKQCLQCPGSTTTLHLGASKLEHCGMPCQAGTYSRTAVEPCLPCPKGYYQPGTGKTTCIACSSPLFTHAEGSVASSQCTNINECSSNPCNNGATCVDGVNGFTCQCKPGFLGRTCEQEKDECASNPCFGEAHCMDLVNAFECVCPLGFKGRYCEDRVAECTQGKCRNGGTCKDTPDGFACTCAAGFTGLLCERTVNECGSSPCKNGAACIDSTNGFTCRCRPGFSGDLCEDNHDDCEQNGLCQNGGNCTDGDNGFSCSCKAGFVGARCEFNVDDCAASPCKNGAKCVDLVNGYKCNCAPTYYGANCDQQRTNTDFDLEFNRDVQTFSEASLHNDLSAFTVSFWMKGRADDLESGTILSYAVDVGDSFVDNALALQDPDAFLLTIMGKELETHVSVGDGEWHHVAVTWSSATGSYAAFQDGIQVHQGSNFQSGVNIPSGGIFILGQEQDEVGRNFSMAESFDGSISQFNMWNKVLSQAEIKDLSRYRCPGVLGNQLAWPDFLEKTVEAKQVNNFCTVKNHRFTDWRSSSSPSNGNERESRHCSNAVSVQCLSTANKNVKGLNLLNTVCSPSSGFTCNRIDQVIQYSPITYRNCPDFKVRFECPHSKAAQCSSSPCKNGATCLETSKSYRCICRTGYMGANCDQEVSCHQMKIANGNVTPYYGKYFIFGCNSGYRLNGFSFVTCVAGSLTGTVPTCQDVNECSSNNGGCQHKCTNVPGSFKCSCNQGYTSSGRTCVDVNECSLNNGNCQQSCTNTAGSYRCRCGTGYKLNVDGKSCEDVNECEAGSHNCEQHCVNSLGSFSCACRPGYALSSDQRTCSRISCPALATPAYGSVASPNSLYGTTAQISCNQGYKLIGSSMRQCLRNGKWSGSNTVCQRVVCQPLGSIHKGTYSRTGNSFGSTYTFSCSSGYHMIGDRQRTCQQSGEWSGAMPRCIPYNCRPVSPPANGRIVGSSLVTGASVLVYCNKGYMLPAGSNNFRTCLSGGSWSNSGLSCVAIRCSALQGIGNGSIATTGTTYGKTVTYSCNQGFGLSGPSVRVCGESGQWSGFAPTCLWRSCGYPGVPANGALDGNDYTYGKKVTYKCSAGFRLIGDTERLCLSGGSWTGSLPECREINCGNPGTPANGEKHGSDYRVGKSVSFDCNAGYSLRGSSLRTCGQSGSWDGAQPRCVSGVCGAGNLVGPTGSFTSRNYPNGYGLNEYCRWAISVKTTLKAALTIKSLKTERNTDRLEVRDGGSGKLISVLSGLLAQPISFTSSSNKLDVKFVSDNKQVTAAEGFEASYHTASCGGLITNIGETLQTPMLADGKYPNGVTCIWQIVVSQPVELDFARFATFDYRDKLEVWNSVTSLASSSFIGQYFGNQGSLLRVKSATGMMYVKFSTDAYHNSDGFRATLKKATVSMGK
eukprot:gene7132-7937_t